MDKENMNKIREIVKERHNKDDFDYHIVPVVNNALVLAKKVGANLEVVKVAALLHDIGRTYSKEEGFNPENEHEFRGEEQSKIILKDLNFEDNFIEKVAYCVLVHRGRGNIKPATIEARVISCADAMAHFDTFLRLFLVFQNTTNSFEEAVDEIDKKMERNWNKKLILPEAKVIVEEKYKAIKILINSMKENMKK
ncbi:HD domain-containing protein [archaeon]|jgi:putative nucleotidyltransferase with HDIG domain|nr:HD domain-containing protein [archaeon]